jgi:membrane protein implicated in regulation of membrane protease activity
MTWTDFYLICFVFGFVMTLFTLLVGVFHIDFPGKWDNFLHGTHGLHFHGHAAHFGHGHGMHVGHHAHGHGSTSDVSPFNFSTAMAFLTWFGAIGYLLTRHSGLIFPMILAVAILSGLTGGSVVFWYMTKFLMRYDASMDPADCELVGVIGTLSVPIRADGVGEIVYQQNGARKSAAACSEDGTAIAKGEEVAVTRFEKGIAYVRRWSELAEEQAVQSHTAE